MKLPKDIAETPYEVVAFRVSHFHDDEDDNDEAPPGTLVVEVAGRLPGTEAEVLVPFELTPESALQLADELLHQYRCVAHGLPEEDEEEES